MRISDWSSDVCSSDRIAARAVRRAAEQGGVVVGADAEEHPGAAADQAGRRDRGILQRLPRHFQQQTLLRIDADGLARRDPEEQRSEEHTSELQSLMRITYAIFCLNKYRQKCHLR